MSMAETIGLRSRDWGLRATIELPALPEIAPTVSWSMLDFNECAKNSTLELRSMTATGRWLHSLDRAPLQGRMLIDWNARSSRNIVAASRASNTTRAQH